MNPRIAHLSILLAMALSLACSWGQRPPISGDPDATGMVVLDAIFRLDGLGEGDKPSLDSDEPARTIGGILTRRDDASEYRGTVTEDHVVVFSDLPPGEYTVVALSAARRYTRGDVLRLYECGNSDCPWAMEVDLILDRETRGELTVEVRAGEVTYAGRLFYREPHGPPFNDIRTSLVSEHNVDYHQHSTGPRRPNVVKGEAAELAALRTVLQTYKSGPWTTLVRKRLEELRGILADPAAGLIPVD